MGLEYARQLAARGCELVIVSNRQEELQAAADKVRADYGVSVVPCFLDLSSWDAADQLYDFCASIFSARSLRYTQRSIFSESCCPSCSFCAVNSCNF